MNPWEKKKILIGKVFHHPLKAFCSPPGCDPDRYHHRCPHLAAVYCSDTCLYTEARWNNGAVAGEC